MTVERRLVLAQTKISNLSEVRQSSSSQWWAGWNLYSGQVCPARGYPGTEQRGADWVLPRMMKLTALHSMFAAQTRLDVYFWLRNVHFSLQHRQTGSLAGDHTAMNGHSKDCSALTSGMWLLAAECNYILHTSPSQISPQSPDLRLALGQSDLSFWWSHYLSQLSLTAISLPAPVLALSLICIVFTQLSPGANS